MAEAIVYNKSAVLEMDKDPKYKDAGETWGKNKLNFVNWDQIEEGGACLFEAAQGSQLLEGDKYPTSPLVVPTAFRLMAYSASSHDVYFQNRDEDEFNDDASNPVIVRHAHLNDKIRLARQLYHERLVSRFDTELPLPVKKFFFVSSMLDPRFKKLQFDGDDMLSAALRRSAIRWLTEEYNANYKGKVYDPDSPAPDSPAPDAAVNVTPPHDHQKRRKVSAAGFLHLVWLVRHPTHHHQPPQWPRRIRHTLTNSRPISHCPRLNIKLSGMLLSGGRKMPPNFLTSLAWPSSIWVAQQAPQPWSGFSRWSASRSRKSAKALPAARLRTSCSLG